MFGGGNVASASSLSPRLCPPMLWLMLELSESLPFLINNFLMLRLRGTNMSLPNDALSSSSRPSNSCDCNKKLYGLWLLWIMSDNIWPTSHPRHGFYQGHKFNKYNTLDTTNQHTQDTTILHILYRIHYHPIHASALGATHEKIIILDNYRKRECLNLYSLLLLRLLPTLPLVMECSGRALIFGAGRGLTLYCNADACSAAFCAAGFVGFSNSSRLESFW